MFKKASEYRNDKISILVYGHPGSGKTTLATTIDGEVLTIDAEGGHQPLTESNVMLFKLSENQDGTFVERKDRFNRFNRFIKALLNGEVDSKLNWIVIDSITEVAQNLIYSLKIEDKKRVAEGGKENKFWVWGEYDLKMTEILKDLRDIPKINVLGLSLVTEEKNEDGSKDITLDVNGKVSQRIPALFDEVYYLHQKEDGSRVLVTQNFKNIRCKSRSGKVEKFEEPNIQKISDKIKGITPKQA